MIKNNKLKTVLSSIVILLPALYGIIIWDKLPAAMMTHWGADGNADGVSTKAFAVFGLPVIMLALHLLGLIVTSFDKKQKGQNKKAIGMIFWILPIISLFTNALVYSLALGKQLNVYLLEPLLFGVMFILIGNYLPKVKQNHTLGIRISWTLNNEENWDKTHRFAGKIWVTGGFVLLASAFLPNKAIIPIAAIDILVLIIAPTVYSYRIHRKHLKAGVSYDSAPKSKREKIITVIIVTVILIALSVLMFTGNVEYAVENNTLKIEADYWSDLEIDCSKIETAEYRDTFDFGVRANGLGSARLAMGNFQNEEFGDYTLYSYTKNKSCIVLRVDGKILVLNGKTADETKELYKLISEKTEK